MKNKYIAVAMFLSALLLPGSIFAATFSGGESYSLPSSEVVDDNLYVGGADITVGGTVQGDLYTAGGMIVVSGDTRDDITAVGGNVSSLGNVGGDARFAGGNILVKGNIGGDLIAGGGSVKTLGDVTVGRDMTLMGGRVAFTGAVLGDALFIGEEIIIDGIIEGNVSVKASKKLTLGENAKINGVLLYEASSEDVLTKNENAMVVGGVQFVQRNIPTRSREKSENGLAIVFGILVLLKAVAVAVAAIVLVLVFKKQSQTVVTTASESFWSQALRGFIVFVMVPVSAILLFITVLGSFLGLMLLVVYGALLVISGIYSGIIFGSWLVKTALKGKEKDLTWWHALMGVVLLFIVGLIPVAGWIIGFIFLLVAIGSFFTMFRDKVWAHR